MSINAQLDELAASAFSTDPDDQEVNENAEDENEESLELGVDDKTDVEESQNEDVEDEDIEYFNQLPEAIGLEADEFYSLKLKLDNGEALTLSEMKDKLQAEKQSRDVLQQKEAALREREQKLASAPMPQAMQEDVAQAQGQLYAIQSAWAGLQQQQQEAEATGDTGALTRVNADMLKLQQMHSTAQQTLQAVQAQAAAQQQQYMQSYVADQQQSLRKLAPTWDGNTTKAVVDYLTGSIGLSPDELNQAFDHRFWVLADKARQWDEHSKNISTAREKVKKGKLHALPGRTGGPVKGKKKKALSELDQIVDRAAKNPREKNAALKALAKGMIDGNF